MPAPSGTNSEARQVNPEQLTPEGVAFITRFKNANAAGAVLERLERLRSVKVLVVGDAIMDEYHFVRPYGMPTKAPIIASQFLSADAYAGGALAVANHVAGFCKQVELVTGLGQGCPHEPAIRAALRPNVQFRPFAMAGRPTTVKRRYLRQFLLQKLFEVSFFDDRPLEPDAEARVLAHLREAIRDYDLVIAADFGHGFITRSMVELLSAQARFLAVNTQLNSINYGYHLVTRYPKADYICIDEDEGRIACRDRQSPVDDIVRRIATDMHVQAITLTLGHHGSITMRPPAAPEVVPVLSRQVVDTVGAGDAFLSVAAPCALLGFPAEVIGFIGNAVGALAVRIVGNAQPVDPQALSQFITGVLGQPPEALGA